LLAFNQPEFQEMPRFPGMTMQVPVQFANIFIIKMLIPNSYCILMVVFKNFQRIVNLGEMMPGNRNLYKKLPRKNAGQHNKTYIKPVF
ncbi:MAG: hypothetical protein ACTHLB_16315, partial [Parafilimonas sp.]